MAWKHGTLTPMGWSRKSLYIPGRWTLLWNGTKPELRKEKEKKEVVSYGTGGNKKTGEVKMTRLSKRIGV